MAITAAIGLGLAGTGAITASAINSANTQDQATKAMQQQQDEFNKEQQQAQAQQQQQDQAMQSNAVLTAMRTKMGYTGAQTLTGGGTILTSPLGLPGSGSTNTSGAGKTLLGA